MEVVKKGTIVNVRFEDVAEFHASYIRDKGGAFKTELKVYAYLSIDDSIRRVRLNRSRPDLLDDLDVGRLVDTLIDKTADYPQLFWNHLVDEARDAIIDTYREGEPAVVVGRLTGFTPRIYDLYPLFVKGVANLIWAPGGSAKSYFGLLTSVMIDKGLAVLDMRARKGKALYLDWEEDYDLFKQRTTAIHKGLGLDDYSGIIYKKMAGSLADNIEKISELVLNNEVTYMVVDSVGAALGGSGVDQDVVENYFAAGNLLGITWVSIDHANRAGERTGNWEIHGSAFKYARARQVYEFRKEQELDNGDIEVGIYHRKANDSGLKAPRLYTVSFASEMFQTSDMDEPQEKLDTVMFTKLGLADASEKYLEKEGIGFVCYELVKAHGTYRLPLLTARVSSIKGDESITESTIKASIGNYRFKVNGRYTYPLKVDNNDSVYMADQEELAEWITD